MMKKLIKNGNLYNSERNVFEKKDILINNGIIEKIGIIVNKNAVQNDPKPKMETSGVRIGTAAITTRGAGIIDANDIALIICKTIHHLRNIFLQMI